MSSGKLLYIIDYRLDQEVRFGSGYNAVNLAKIIGIKNSVRNVERNTMIYNHVSVQEINKQLFNINGQYFHLLQKFLMFWLNSRGIRIIQGSVAVMHSLYIEIFPHLALNMVNSYFNEIPLLG